MTKGVVFAVWVVSGATVACGSSLSSAPDDGGGKDGTTHDAKILVEASEPDTGHDAAPPPTDARTDSTRLDARADGGHLDGPPPDTPESADAPDDAPIDALADAPVDAPIDAPNDAPDSPADAIEAEGGCLPEAPDTSTGLFVVVGGSTSSSCGAESSPCATLDLALSIARSSVGTDAGVTTIYVGPGTFTETGTVALVNGVAIVGGWDVTRATWTHSCVAPTFNGPSPVFSATNLTSSTTLDTLDVVVTSVAKKYGGSLYGITSDSSVLALRNVSVTVPPGAAGQDGTGGKDGKAGGLLGCNTAGTGASGMDGGDGNPTAAGTFGAPPGGYVAPSNGTSGGTGATGSNGTAGGAGASEPGTSHCNASTPCDGPPKTYHGDPGLGGCAGTGGTGGTPGTGGGCSIAVYAWGGSVTISGGTLSTGNGGAGGNGGAASSGGPGEPGATGAQVEYLQGCAWNPLHSICTAEDAYADGGAPGGKGGSGGGGGRGGGGAGGCSYGYYAGYGATVAPTGVLYLIGAGGVGGTPNGSVGPSGSYN
jgi:hypothetical protein